MALNIHRNPGILIALAVSLPVIVWAFSRLGDLRARLRTVPAPVRLYALLSAAGICLYARQNLDDMARSFLGAGREGLSAAVHWLTIVAALAAIAAVYALVSLLLGRTVSLLRPLFRSLSGTEAVFLAAVTAALAAFAAFAFLRSRAFWDPGASYDVIYTSDSPGMFRPNVFLNLYHPENDLRQPLFAVFAAPLTGPAYLLAAPFAGAAPVAVPLLINMIQIPLLTTGHLMLAGILGLKGRNRICFLAVASATYTTLLFSVMTEQYVVGYFWLILAVYAYTETGETPVLFLSAAGGTLMTGLAMTPLSCRPEGEKNRLKSFVSKAWKAALGFLTLLLAFGRLDVLLDLPAKTAVLSSFAGGYSPAGRVNQYLAFVASCFAAPAAAADTVTCPHASWQLTALNVTRTNPAGLILLILCAVSLAVNRREKGIRIAGLWAGFSALLLCLVGWGSPENGMILYSLYFGWAFLLPLFRLAERTGEKLGLPLLTPAVSCTIVAVLGFLNIQGIRQLLDFAVSCYPLNGGL